MLSPEVEYHRKRIYKEMIANRVICSEQISISDAKSEYLIRQLFRAFYSHPKQLPDYVLEKYCRRNDMEFNRANLKEDMLRKDPNFIRTICDHISGMTDWLYPEFCVNSALDVKRSKIFTRRHCNSRPPL